jgi:hypothetical protein
LGTYVQLRVLIRENPQRWNVPRAIKVKNRSHPAMERVKEAFSWERFGFTSTQTIMSAKVFATPEAADEWFRKNDPEGVVFGYEVLEWQTKNSFFQRSAGRAHIIAEYLQPGRRNADETMTQLIAVLDSQALPAAIERLEKYPELLVVK